MKVKRIILSVSLVFYGIFNGFSQVNPERLDITNGWKIKTGDQPEFASPGYDDNNWEHIRVGEYWDTQGYGGYDGVAWYRLRVIIPSSLRRDNKYIRSLKIGLGKIAAFNVTYINGTAVGKCDRIDIPSEYAVPFDIIHWDAENVIAVRVQDYWGGGGLFSGIYALGFLDSFPEYITIQSDNNLIENILAKDSVITKKITFNLAGAFDMLPAKVWVKITDSKTRETYFDKTFNISIGSGADSSFTYSVKLKKNGWYKADYCLFSEHLSDTVYSSTLLAYKQEDHSNAKRIYPVVEKKVPDKTIAFDLDKIHLDSYLDGRIRANIEERLLKIAEKEILECFYNRPGGQAWVGEYAGKYLHAAARAWSNSGNQQLKTQMDRIADILISAQTETGYLGTYLPVNHWTEWDVWTHKYDLLGLLSYYAVTGYKPALETSIRIGNLLCKIFGILPGQLNIEETGYHVGMASCSVLEPMTELYRFTGDKKYLEFCEYIIDAYEHPKGPKIISTLNKIGKVNKIANAKAYEMLSNLTGVVKLYQLTGESTLITAMEKAWSDISVNKLYITGTSSKGELFQDDFLLPADTDAHMGEGCVTTTWLQFNQALYYLSGEAKYMAEIEKTIFNHLLAAENPHSGCVSYYTALQGKKPFNCKVNGNCCLASVPRGIVAIPELAYTRNPAGGFNINLYTAGKFADKIMTRSGKEVMVGCIIESDFPATGKVSVTLNPETKAVFSLFLRVPDWCRNFKAIVDSRIYDGIPGNYLNLEQAWGTGSIISITYDLNLSFPDGGKSYPGYMAIKSGPQVLAVDQSLNPEIKDLDKLTLNSSNLVTLSKTFLPQGWIGSQIYGIKALYEGKPVDLKLVPFADAGQTDGDIRVWIPKN